MVHLCTSKGPKRDCKFCDEQILLLPDMLQLKWLPVSEHTGFLVAKLAWKSVNNSNWPKFLPMKVRSPTRTRRGNQEALLVSTCNIENTFGVCAPKDVRKCGEYKVFLKKTKTFF